MTKDTNLQLQPTVSTTSLLKGENVKLTPTTAWQGGTNLQRAAKEMPDLTRAWLVAEVGRLCKDVDANKTLTTTDDFVFTCRAILDEFPAIKVEEIRVAFDMIRKGQLIKLYERLKTAEILEALRAYEGSIRTELLETQHKEVYESTGPLQPLGLAQLAATLKDERRPFVGSGTRLRQYWEKNSTPSLDIEEQ
jgi:hypothetical protein